MRITFTTDIGNRRRGQTTDIDDGSAQLLIAHGYAEPAADPNPAADPPPSTENRTRRRSRRVIDEVGDDPHPGSLITGTS